MSEDERELLLKTAEALVGVMSGVKYVPGVKPEMVKAIQDDLLTLTGKLRHGFGAAASGEKREER